MSMGDFPKFGKHKKGFAKAARILCMTVLVIPFLLFYGHLQGSAKNVTSDLLRQREQEVAAAQREREELRARVTDLQGMRRRLESQKSDLAAYVAELDGMLAEIQENINALELQTARKEEEILKTQAELERAIEAQNKQYDDMVLRVRRMYMMEGKDEQVVELLVKAGGLREMLNYADYYQRIVNFDRDMYDSLVEGREYVELCAQKLEIEKEILDESRAKAQEEKENLQILIDEKNGEILAYESRIANTDAAIAEEEAQIRQQNEEIAALEAAVAAERKRLLEEQGALRRYDGGTFCQPLASYTRISDDYGYRMHPILNVRQFHNGVDFAAPYGTAIYAAYDGSVTAAGYSSSMGNYVMIDHGDSLFTIYMHASALYVKTGDVVAKGETIAAVGSTGRSTGNHLHFSVRKDGDYVSPWEYLQ